MNSRFDIHTRRAFGHDHQRPQPRGRSRAIGVAAVIAVAGASNAAPAWGAGGAWGGWVEPSPAPAAAPSAPAPAPAPVGADAGVLVGRWDGHIQLPGAKLALNFDLVNTGGVITGDLSIPQQGAEDLPVPDVQLRDDAGVMKVEIRVPAIPPGVRFEGVLEPGGKVISGTFRQGPASLPFRLEKADAKGGEAGAGEELEGFTAWLKEQLAAWQVPSAGVVIVRDGRVIFAEGVGLADVESSRAATADTAYAIGSCTKAFTAFTVATVVRDGALDWDQPVRARVPEFALADESAAGHVTLRDMITHRTGMPRHEFMWYGTARPRAELFAGLRHLPLSKDLRQTWQYNNLMYLAAGHVLERVTGKSWEDLVRERIATPLAMSSVSFSASEAGQRAGAAGGAENALATPYDHRVLEDEAGTREIRRIEFREIANIGPAGSINMSVRDLGAWLSMLTSGGRTGAEGGERLLEASAIRELLSPQIIMPIPRDPTRPEIVPIGYAMGWMSDVYRGRPRAHHGGNIDGFSAAMAVLPDERIGVGVLTNMNGTPVPDLVIMHALDRLLKAERRDWSGELLAQVRQARTVARQAKADRGLARVEGTRPAHALAAYAGRYAHPGYGTVEVRHDGDGLTLLWNSFVLPMEHWHFDVFSVRKVERAEILEGTRVQFTTSMDGAVDGLRVAAEPTLPPATFARLADTRLTDPAYLARLAGAYTLGPQTITITLRGSAISMSIPGQPTLDLIPAAGGAFAIKDLDNFSVVFVEEGGAITALRSIQPNGVFTAKRAE